MPADEIPNFMKRVYKLLAPGYRVIHTTGAGEDGGERTRRGKKKDVTTNWMDCSDLTVQVFPKSPGVLWLDVECMTCKSGDDGQRKRHLSSRKVIKTVVRVVVDFTENTAANAGVKGSCRSVYVTRGKTCGMHVFFPYVLCWSEQEVHDVWTAVNKRLVETEQHAVTVDTGCSAMPLILSRHHTGLTKVDVVVERKTTEDEKMEHHVVISELKKPSLNDFARFTNFYHLFAKRNNNSDEDDNRAGGYSNVSDNSSGTIISTVADSTCTRKDFIDAAPIEEEAKKSTSHQLDELEMGTTTNTTVSAVKRKASPEERPTEEESCCKMPRLELADDPTKDRCEAEPDTGQQLDDEEKIGTTTDITVSAVKRKGLPDNRLIEEESGSKMPRLDDLCAKEDGCEMIAVAATTDTISVMEENTDDAGEQQKPATPVEDDADEKSSNVSSASSKKRHVQSDIRTMLANMTTKRSLPDDDDNGAESVASDNSAKRKKLEPQVTVFEEDDGNMSLCMGYEPSSVRSSGPCSVVSLNEDDDDAASTLTERRKEEGGCAVEKNLSQQQLTSRPFLLLNEREEVYDNDDGEGVAVVEKMKTTNTLPALFAGHHTTATAVAEPRVDLHNIKRIKEEFADGMKLNVLDNRNQNPVHETDVQLITSAFNAEVDFYVTMVKDSVPVGGRGLRVKTGCSLTNTRENCPTGLFEKYVPHVLYSEDFVAENEWLSVLVRYYDEYLNNAPFLFVMMRVLKNDRHVLAALEPHIRRKIYDCAERCLLRFQVGADHNDRQENHRVPKTPNEDKCIVVVGLITVCSSAFKIVTPIFTDLAKTCRLLLGKSQQTSDTLNTSTMPTAAATTVGGCYGGAPRDDPFLDESASQVGCKQDEEEGGGSSSSVGGEKRQEWTTDDKNAPLTCVGNIGNDHSVLASVLRWNYDAMCDQTRWCLFFYYYHVHSDGLTRILNEVVHDGLMVTAVLQAYFESFANNQPVDIGFVCRQAFRLDAAFRSLTNSSGGGSGGNKKQRVNQDKRLMPPPPLQSTGSNNRRKYEADGPSEEYLEKKREFDRRNENSKKAQRKFQQERNGPREKFDNSDDDEDGGTILGGGGGLLKPTKGRGGGAKEPNVYTYHTNFEEVLSMFVKCYLRPVSFDETTVVYTETGYEQRQNEVLASFSSCKKEEKASIKEMLNRATLRYSMPHGDLSMFNTDVMGAVHSRSSCTNNLVLNIFENMYGGCMTYLTRRYNNNLNHTNRFSGDAYRLVVECRHAAKELIQSIDLSYINLILRQPIVPPVLESDIRIRNMYMCGEEIMRGAFVCLNSMDYLRAVNMFTRHSRFSQDNCDVAESFLDGVIDDSRKRRSGGSCSKGVVAEGDEDARMRFRTVYLFFLLYMFEVLYKIRHSYNKESTYNVSIERLSRDVDVRMLLKLFFGSRDFKMPRGLSAETLKMLNMPTDLYDEREYYAGAAEDDLKTVEGNRALAARCINTRSTVSAVLVDKEERMVELFKKKGIVIMKSFAPRFCGGGGGPGCDGDSSGNNECDDGTAEERRQQRSHRLIDGKNIAEADHIFAGKTDDGTAAAEDGVYGVGQQQQQHLDDGLRCEELERTFLDMTQAKLEDALYSSATWYENCRVRMKAAARAKHGAEKKLNDVEMGFGSGAMDTFQRTQLRVQIDNDRLNHIDRAVRGNKDFAFCTLMPLRAKMIALVLATHATKRMSSDVAADFVRKEYRLERSGALRNKKQTRRRQKRKRADGSLQSEDSEEDDDDPTDETIFRPDVEWEQAWTNLLAGRVALLTHCRSLAETNFPNSYFVGLRPDDAYNTLYNYMTDKPQYKKFRELRNETWARDVCVAMNFLLVMNAYDCELVELCLRLFLAFEWPGQWAKRIFVWKSNSNAGKSFFFESIISKVFDHSTTINDPKGGKDNAPEKSEYYKNFLLMINEFTTASSCELKRLCSMSGYKFRMNFGNQMIQAYMVGKMVFNCNTLPLTTDHATIQRVALIPLPFWFNKRQTVVDSMLNWTIGQSTAYDYENNFRRRISRILTPDERQFFIDNPETRNENDLFNEPDDYTLKQFSYISTRQTGAPVFLVQNKTSQVYMSSSPATGTIISGIMSITRYFCRFRYFNKIKEPVDFSTIPTACMVASREWERFSQPYYEWKERYRVEKDNGTRTKVSVIHTSLSYFAKNCSKNTSFFDLRQFFEVDFVDSKIQYYSSNREDEYYVRLDPLQE